MVVTAACALAESSASERSHGCRRGAATSSRPIRANSRRSIRREVARTLGLIGNTRFRPLLVPLMFDADLGGGARRRSAAPDVWAPRDGDFLFVPPLVSLMRNRLLKRAAREVLVGYGGDVVDTLAYFLSDPEEDIWVRRHVPATLAPDCHAAVDGCAGRRARVTKTASCDSKPARAIERLRRTAPALTLDRAVIERQILQESMRAFSALTLHHNLFVAGGLEATSVLAQALTEKHQRALSRIFRLLGLLYHAGRHQRGPGRRCAAQTRGCDPERWSISTTCSPATCGGA